MTKKMALVSIMVLCISFLSGCQNTIKGMGKDMQHAGQELQK